MRDGTILYGDLYRPQREERLPVLVVRTPYGVQQPSALEKLMYFAEQGYAVLVQDVRGRYESGGVWEPFRNEAADGHDTIQWVAQQPWCTGKVGMQGGSYVGFVQWRAASQGPSALTTIFPIVAATSIYHTWVRSGGGFHLAFNFTWGVVRMPSRTTLTQDRHVKSYAPEHLRFDPIFRSLPVNDLDLRCCNNPVQHYRDWLAHPSYDDYWTRLSPRERFEDVKVPVHTFGGWYDIFLCATINGFVGVRTQGGSAIARAESKMVIGPWGHSLSTKVGAVDFGPAARLSLVRRELRWFGHYLKGEDNGIDREPPVKLFYMGVNRWSDEDDWPIPGTRFTPFYLSSSGRANTAAGNGSLTEKEPGGHRDAGFDHYLYDPEHPVPTHGGKTCGGAPTASGTRNQRPIEAREDVLVYTSHAFQEPFAIAGPLKVRLFAATDGPDTDFVARLVDVHPSGRPINLAEGILRCRYRNGFQREELLEPCEVYEFEIDLLGTANVFLKGHRIRLQITSSNFPQFDRNPNTGEDPGSAVTTRVARQTVFHSKEYPSHVLLPVVEVPR